MPLIIPTKVLIVSGIKYTHLVIKSHPKDTIVNPTKKDIGVDYNNEFYIK